MDEVQYTVKGVTTKAGEITPDKWIIEITCNSVKEVNDVANYIDKYNKIKNNP